MPGSPLCVRSVLIIEPVCGVSVNIPPQLACHVQKEYTEPSRNWAAFAVACKNFKVGKSKLVPKTLDNTIEVWYNKYRIENEKQGTHTRQGDGQ